MRLYHRLPRLLAAILFCSLPHTVLAERTDGAALAAKNQCMGCHQVEKRRVGPSFLHISERFMGNAGAAAYLAQAIREGGRGRWGAVPMPAQPQVSHPDALALAQWILQLSPTNTGN